MMRVAHFWALVYTGLMIATVLACAFGTQGRFFAHYDNNVLVIALAVLACSLMLDHANKGFLARGRYLHRVNAYLNSASSPMLMGVLAAWLVAPPALHNAAAGWSDNLHLLLGNLAIVWAGVTVVRLLHDPHPDLQ